MAVENNQYKIQETEFGQKLTTAINPDCQNRFINLVTGYQVKPNSI